MQKAKDQSQPASIGPGAQRGREAGQSQPASGQGLEEGGKLVSTSEVQAEQSSEGEMPPMGDQRDSGGG